VKVLLFVILLWSSQSFAIWEQLAQISYRLSNQKCSQDNTAITDNSRSCTGETPAKKNLEAVQSVHEDLYFSSLAQIRKEALTCAESELKHLSSNKVDFKKWADDLEIKVDALAVEGKNIELLSQELLRNQRVQKKLKLSKDDVKAKQKSLLEAQSRYSAIFASIPFSDLKDVQNLISNQVADQMNGQNPVALSLKEMKDLKFREKLNKVMTSTMKTIRSDTAELQSGIDSWGVKIDRGLRESLAQDYDLVAAFRERDRAGSSLSKSISCSIDEKYGKGAELRDRSLMIGSLASTGFALGIPRLALAGWLGRAAAGAAAGGQISVRSALIYKAAVTYLPLTVSAASAGNAISKSCFNYTSRVKGTSQPGKNQCSQYSIKNLSHDNCVLEASLGIVGGAAALSRTGAGVKLLSHIKKAEPIIPDIQKAYTISVTNAAGQVEQRTIRLLPKNTYGMPESFEGKVYELAMTVDSREEGYSIFQSLVRKGPNDWKNAVIPPLQEGKNAFDVDKKLYAYIRPTESGHEVGKRPLELVVTFPNESDGPAEAVNLLKSLQAHKLKAAPTALQDMDLSSVGAKNEWAKYSFSPWAKNLSREEKDALTKLGGPEYRDVNRYLRSPNTSKDFEIDSIVTKADTAISKASLNRDITTYRYDSSQDLAELWDKLSKTGNTKVKVPLRNDPAYTFTTIDPTVADWWNKSQLKGKGILLQIDVPKGTPAAFLDAQGIHSNRGYLELVLPRNSPFEVIGATQTSTGQKVLKVRYKAN